MIIPLDSADADLGKAGGKAANLARLAGRDFPIPPGFIIPTEAYSEFVHRNALDELIAGAVGNLSGDDPGALEWVSRSIRSAFSRAEIATELENEIKRGYEELGRGPVAVRSSATLEDLPDLSFAGQQDTYLNVVTEADLLEAVVHCWSSLWTARAIGYRISNEVPHDEAALAVLVQAMVDSEVAGVLFTANPVTGLLRESVIDATFGLGEALVSGQVEPDHFVVDHVTGSIVKSRIGEKRVSSRGRAGGGVAAVEEYASEKETLTEDQILQIVDLGQAVQEDMGRPQDIEWAIAEGEIFLLQSRPITSLFPVPDQSFEPLEVWFSFGSVQGLMGPMTPLGRDVICSIIAGGARIFGLEREPDELGLLDFAGERLWIRISDIVRNPIGHRVFSSFLGMVEPSVAQITKQLASEPEMRAGQGKIKLTTLLRMARFALPVLARSLRNMACPSAARADFDALLESDLAEAKITPAPSRFERLQSIVEFIRGDIGRSFPKLVPQFIPILGPSMLFIKLLERLAPDERRLELEVTRGLPGNVTTQMDLALWDTAARIKLDERAAEVLHQTDPRRLAERYLSGELPEVAQVAIADFLAKYGQRGVGEIDMGRARWRDDPTPVMRTLQSYLKIRPDAAPDVQFARGEKAAERAIDSMAAEVREQRGGIVKVPLVRAISRRVRLLMGARESPKFFVIRKMGIARRALLEVGEEFVAGGTLDQPDDLAYLTIFELEALASGSERDWRGVVSERRAVYRREERRRQVPRVLVSDGRAFYEGLGVDTDDDDVITGSPVSPGKVQGKVRIVFDPNEAHLAPGDILVCPGTDPAWTPLFMVAGGLITEVGGMMTHGSVVAREYGIPAVVGVHQATQRLQDGQTVRLDGASGTIEVVES